MYKSGFGEFPSGRIPVQNIEGHTSRIADKKYVFQDLEGNLNKNQIETIRAVADELLQREHVIGIIPFGSTTLGYRTNDSDIDLYVAVDYNIELPTDLAKESNVKIHLCKRFISMNTIENALLAEDDKNLWRATGMLKYLCQLTIGKKIETYRKRAAEIIHRLPEDRQTFVKNEIVEELMHQDEHSYEKLNRRIGKGIVDIDKADYLSKRRILREDQIFKFLEYYK